MFISQVSSIKKVNKTIMPYSLRVIVLPKYNKELYYSRMINDKQCIFSFLNVESSKNCLSFLEKYKKIHKKYPCPEQYKNTSPLENEFACYIDNKPIAVLKNRCLLNNIGLIGINYFDYTFYDNFAGEKNVFNVNISSVDLLTNEKITVEDQIDQLNYLLDF